MILILFIMREGGSDNKHSWFMWLINNYQLIWEAYYRRWNGDFDPTEYKLAFSHKQVVEAKFQGFKYCYESGYWNHREYRLSNNCLLIGKSNMLYLDIPIEDQDNIEGQVYKKIDDVLRLGVFQTTNEKERKIIHDRFKFKEMEFDIYYNSKPLFETLLHEDEYHYETTAYLKVNKSSELYSYNVTAKKERRDYNLPDDLYKIELRLKFPYFKELFKVYPEVRTLNPVELFEWLKSRTSAYSIINKSLREIRGIVEEPYIRWKILDDLNREWRELKAS